ncbi:hypothetical protein Val02_60300 [Virgisporangium aliadipatigenens]|uniref:Hsp70 family protein n=1 Tax=Virgisporangium aliadipatigenens TaxID=741659 RepID=A0A8J3YP32_9ACTN|nr:Hsp70 family protein [Virgisporangium aliadipatigenens]GIJ49144.1 hypothetical protein Val02_60300 [Virgisporangium aliadipatigenens]
MDRTGFRLGIDFGTSHTVAVLHWPDGRAKVLLFDGSPLLPSAVYAEPDGRLVVGRDAVNSSRIDPGRYEPNPKRRIDDGSVLLGEFEFPVEDVIAAVLRLVADEAARTAGVPLTAITLTCPAAWGPRRRRILVTGAARAGFPDVRVIEEPVAAATYFAQVLGHRMAVGSAVVVYDFGGGTFDVSVLERTVYGFRTLAVDGRDDIGGLDLDEALIDFLVAEHSHHDPPAWRRLQEPATSHERRQRRLFRDDVRGAKERLSRHPTAELYVPGFDRNVHVTREEFEAVVRPLLDETVRLTGALVRRTGVSRVAGVFLVGGSSRLPLVSTLVHRTLGNPPTVIEQPELVVAEGSVLVRGVGAAAALPGAEQYPPGLPGPLDAPGPFGPPDGAGPTGSPAAPGSPVGPGPLGPRPPVGDAWPPHQPGQPVSAPPNGYPPPGPWPAPPPPAGEPPGSAPPEPWPAPHPSGTLAPRPTSGAPAAAPHGLWPAQRSGSPAPSPTNPPPERAAPHQPPAWRPAPQPDPVAGASAATAPQHRTWDSPASPRSELPAPVTGAPGAEDPWQQAGPPSRHAWHPGGRAAPRQPDPAPMSGPASPTSGVPGPATAPAAPHRPAPEPPTPQLPLPLPPGWPSSSPAPDPNAPQASTPAPPPPGPQLRQRASAPAGASPRPPVPPAEGPQQATPGTTPPADRESHRQQIDGHGWAAAPTRPPSTPHTEAERPSPARHTEPGLRAPLRPPATAHPPATSWPPPPPAPDRPAPARPAQPPAEAPPATTSPAGPSVAPEPPAVPAATGRAAPIVPDRPARTPTAEPPAAEPPEPATPGRPEHDRAERGRAAPGRAEPQHVERERQVPGRGGRRGTRARRAVVLAVALAAIVALALSVASFRKGDRSGPGRATPATSQPADGSLTSAGPPDPCWSGATREQAPAGAPAAKPAFTLDDRWRWHEDPTGYRIPVLKEWQQSQNPAGVCFAEPHGAVYLGVRVSPAGDDPAAHIRAVEERARALPGYQRVAVIDRPESAFPTGLEFTFKLGDDLMRAEIHSQTSGPRIYDVYWCTWDDDWKNNRQDLSVVIGGFRPAQ